MVWVVLTPEEWVRQHVIGFLTNHREYPKSLMKTETAHKTSLGIRRTDIIICDKYGEPLMLVECKAPNVKLTQKTVEQIANYNLTLNAKYLLITNGINNYGFTIDSVSKTIKRLETIPYYSEL